MIKEENLKAIKTILAGGRARLWCGFCNKAHTHLGNCCEKFLSMIRVLADREE